MIALDDPRLGPIGLFDSGVGGLSVLRAVHAVMPDESLFYIADSANCPYGPRSADEILALSHEIARYMVACGAKLIVVACNTASAAALADLRASFDVPFIGMVPAVKPAVESTRAGVIGVLATPTTLEGALYHEVVQHYAVGARIVSRVCEGLVERVEQGDVDGPATMSLLRACLEPILEEGADRLVLGCTHYPFLIPAIRKIVSEGVQILDPSEAVARQTARVLERNGLMRPASAPPEFVFATTGSPSEFSMALTRLLGWKREARALRWMAGQLRP